MRTKQFIGAIVFMAIAMSLTSASAQLSVVEEYSYDFDHTTTPWDMSVMVPYYDPAVHGGAPLEEIVVVLEGAAKSDVDVTANGGEVLVLEGDVGAYITASGFVSGLTIDVLPMGQFAPPTITVPPGSMINLTDVMGNDSDMLVMSGIANVSAYEGTGTYQVDVNSLGTSSLRTSGGNMDASQRTISNGRLTVQYKAIAVPEPATMVCLLLGAVGLGLLRR